MSQSPLARSTRKSLPAFAHPPSRLSKSTSVQNFRNNNDSETESPSSTPERGATSNQTPISTPTPTPTNASGRYKDASSGTGTGAGSRPSTPKIMYSPYATSSPHAGPSRSASIPFDMAASARDARRKSIGPVRDREDTPDVADQGVGEEVSVNTSSSKRRKAIMRKKPFFTR